jgi:tRNA-modifying protein YgfZ
VTIDGPTPVPGTAVTADGREVGEMRSSRGGLGLALLRIEPMGEGKTLAAGDATLVPLRPAWMRVENDVSP